MQSNGARLPENLLFPNDPSRPDLDALRIAKAKQDLSHRKLDRWIAAAIAELSERAARDQPSAPGAARTRGGNVKRNTQLGADRQPKQSPKARKEQP